jgi:hypothetical protein
MVNVWLSMQREVKFRGPNSGLFPDAQALQGRRKAVKSDGITSLKGQ